MRKLVRELWMDLEFVVGETFRESNGLAMSSLNKYLTEEERRKASVLYRGLIAAQEQVKGGERHAEALRLLVRSFIEE